MPKPNKPRSGPGFNARVRALKNWKCEMGPLNQDKRRAYKFKKQDPLNKETFNKVFDPETGLGQIYIISHEEDLVKLTHPDLNVLQVIP